MSVALKTLNSHIVSLSSTRKWTTWISALCQERDETGKSSCLVFHLKSCCCSQPPSRKLSLWLLNGGAFEHLELCCYIFVFSRENGRGLAQFSFCVPWPHWFSFCISVCPFCSHSSRSELWFRDENVGILTSNSDVCCCKNCDLSTEPSQYNTSWGCFSLDKLLFIICCLL